MKEQKEQNDRKKVRLKNRRSKMIERKENDRMIPFIFDKLFSVRYLKEKVSFLQHKHQDIETAKEEEKDLNVRIWMNRMKGMNRMRKMNLNLSENTPLGPIFK